ncbi:magnesium/cobalt transporter CorA [Vibrio sp. SM6]|uniref:Magnesium transport protein CorA n=1 Tax=Vibrio agarilyticus TaxID=2726741 RepID=A0A7X8TNL1_9VIBR|nr:magnesium/cobalt transporter CorA [Vibrio agarilyticus]NLS11850.1 magnesium/cobalt transporter CorA [Vibrio agarilyticus]
MLRFFTIEAGLLLEMAHDESRDRVQLAKQAVWIDALDPTDDERQAISELLQIELPETEAVEEIETSARFFVDKSGVHVHSLFLQRSDGRYLNTSVACILQHQRLVTIRDEDIADFRLLRFRARRQQIRCQNVESLIITILEQKIENHADMLEDIHRALEKISHQVLEEQDADLEECINQLAALEDSNGKVRLCLMDTQRALSFLLRNLKSRESHKERIQDVARDVESLMSHTTFLFDKINFLMDSTQGFISIQQNQIIKIFSIAAVVFLPPTVIASIFGMNFKFMPSLDWSWGYPAALLLMLASGFAPYLYFKRKGWL